MLLPGPPYELKGMFESECIPRLRARVPEQHIAMRTLKMAMIPVSQVDARVAYGSTAMIAMLKSCGFALGARSTAGTLTLEHRRPAQG